METIIAIVAIVIALHLTPLPWVIYHVLGLFTPSHVGPYEDE